MRLDQALLLDARTALASSPIRLFLVLEAVASLVFLQRRGSDVASSVLLVWLAMLILAFFAWWAGRHPRAHPRPDAVPGAVARVVFGGLTVGGMLAWSWGVGTAIGVLFVACGLAGWLWSALRSGGWRGAGAILGRDVRPFVPLLLLVAIPRLVLGGPAFLIACLAFQRHRAPLPIGLAHALAIA
jgi:hypothetical protein